MENTRLSLIRSMVQLVINHLQVKEINFYGLAMIFEKCADICRQQAKDSNQFDTKYKAWNHEREIHQYDT
jgi:hypothetical protein